jgi:RNA polymerase sigma-70 factor (ECF subfamily)
MITSRKVADMTDVNGARDSGYIVYAGAGGFVTKKVTKSQNDRQKRITPDQKLTGGRITDLKDEHLMALYRQGGEEGVRAFDTLYRQFAPKVYGYLKKQLGDSAAADEVFQQAMLRFHETRDRYDPRYPLGPWLFTICRNTMRDHQRRQVRRREQALPDELPEPAEEAQASVTEIPLAALSSAQRAAVEMRYLNEMTFAEIAACLQVSETNTRQMISRGIRSLRRFMEGKKRD